MVVVEKARAFDNSAPLLLLASKAMVKIAQIRAVQEEEQEENDDEEVTLLLFLPATVIVG